MAELGTIQTTNLAAGQRPADTRAIERGIGQALDVLGQMRVRSVTDDVRESVEGAVTSTVAESQAQPIESLDTNLPPEVDAFRRRILDLQDVVRQGNSSMQARAQLKIKQEMNRAVSEHPALADQIIRVGTQTANLNPQLDALGLMDTIAASQADTAQKQLDDIMDFATKPVSENGLGMPVDANFSDPNTIKEFKRRQMMYNVGQADELEFMYMTAQQNRQDREKLEVVQRNLNSYSSDVNRRIEGWTNDLGSFFAEMAKPPEERDQSIIDTAIDQRQAIAAEAEQLALTVRSWHEQAWPAASRSGPYYENSKQALDSKVEFLRQFADGVLNIKSETYYDQLMAHTKSQMMVDNLDNAPWRQMQAWLAADPNGVLFRIAKESPIGADLEARNEFANTALQAMYGMMGGWNASTIGGSMYKNGGGNNIGNSATPTDIRRTLRRTRNNGPSTFGGLEGNELEETQSAVGQLIQYENMLGKLVEFNEDDNPALVSRILLPTLNALEHMNDLGVDDRDATDIALNTLASPNVLNGLTALGDGAYKNRRVAFGMGAKEFLGDINGPVAKQRQEVQMLWATPYRNGQLSDFVTVDFSEEGDTLRYGINDDMVEEAYLADLRLQGDRDMLVAGNQQGINTWRREIAERMDQIMGFANKDVRASAHVDYAESVNIEDREGPSYRLWADRTGWLDLLMGE